MFFFKLAIADSHKVIDNANVLSKNELDEVEKHIKNINLQNKIDLFVVLVNSIEKQSLDDYSIKMANELKINSNNGVLFLFSINDRKFRIEFGKGLANSINENKLKEIQERVKPFLKDKKYKETIIVQSSLVNELVIKELSETYEPKRNIILNVFYLILFVLFFFKINYSIFVLPKKIKTLENELKTETETITDLSKKRDFLKKTINDFRVSDSFKYIKLKNEKDVLNNKIKSQNEKLSFLRKLE